MQQRSTLKKLAKKLAWLALLAWLGAIAWQTHKPLPAGVQVSSAAVLLPENAVRLLIDLTYQTTQGQTTQGQRVSEQQIFDAVLQQIDAAQRFVVLDFFLFNDAIGDAGKAFRPLSRELADHLLARKRAVPALNILLITDPINDVYGGAPSALLTELSAAGIDVVRTDLPKLRDSNPVYSVLWRGLIQWWGNSDQGGWLANPFDQHAAKITLRSWLSLLNFKANHRKVVVSDRADGNWVALIASANPHDASSAHSNVALQFTGDLVKTVLASEINIARFSGWSGAIPAAPHATPIATAGAIELAYLTEGAIRDRVLRELAQVEAGDQVRLAMFYLSDRALIAALTRAAARGASVQLILDPNKDAFGIEKDGVPNRPVANELVTDSHGKVAVRWYRTHGEQFHTKLLSIRRGTQLFATLGSANFTRRNIGDYNLEANVAVSMMSNTQLAARLDAYFDRLWQGDAVSVEYTAPFGVYRDPSPSRYWRYRLMEATGLSTF